MPRNIPIQIRRGTNSEWNNQNPILDTGEPGYDSTNKFFKIGDGSSTWTSLSSINLTSTNITDFSSAVNNLLPTISSSGNNRILTSTGTSTGITAETNLTFDGSFLSITGSGSFSGNITSSGNVSGSVLISTNSSGTEGGEISLAKPASDSTLNGNVNIDIFGNKLRIFETSSPNRGFHLDITEGISGVGSPLRQKSFALFTARDHNPPASNFATLDTRNSILVLDFDDAVTEIAYFVGVIPESVNTSSGLDVRINWSAVSATTNNCNWESAFIKMPFDLDAFPTPTAVTSASTASSTNGSQSIATLSHTSSQIDSLTGGDFFLLRISRLGGSVADNMVGDAELISVEVRSRA